MSTRKIPSLLLSVGCTALAVCFAACNGGSGGGSSSGGDLTNCQVVWANAGSVAGRFDIYLLDMPIDQWTGDADKTYSRGGAGEERTAILYDELLVASNAYYSRAITTNGAFHVTANQGTAMGEPVVVSDDGFQTYFDLPSNDVSGVAVGSGGVASFDGVWSDPADGATPTPGSVGGRVYVRYLTDSAAQAIGAYTRYAVCYHAGSGFAPVSAADRAARQLQTVPLFKSTP